MLFCYHFPREKDGVQTKAEITWQKKNIEKIKEIPIVTITNLKYRHDGTCDRISG